MHKEYARLEQELLGEDYAVLLQGLKETDSFFHRFETWADVVEFMRDKTLNANLTDEVLRPIFKAHSESGDYRWRTILLVIFWPGLRSINWKKRDWDIVFEERWQNVVWTFLEVVCRIDIGRRQSRLVQKVINDTVHRLYDEYSQIWKIKNHEITPENDESESLIKDFGGSSQENRQFAWIRKLRTYKQEGRINEADFLLLVGTRVYGKPLVDYAREHGMDYQVLSKRRRRAEAAIRNYEKNFYERVQKSGKTPPLYSVGNLNRKG